MAYTTINKSSSFQNQVLYTGNASTNAITGVNFQPDLVWGKDRGGDRHWWLDSVRGKNGTGYSLLCSNDTSLSSTNYPPDGITAIGSDGFTLGANTSNDNGGWSSEINQNSGTYVAWNWKAGTAVSGNTSGSGTYKTYTGSVNTTSGFSIIKYVGNGTAGHTIPHHLGAVPKMIIMKRINAAGGSAGLDAWQVYHQALGNTKRLVLNSTGGEDASTTYFNDTTPTSSVFTLGTGPAGNNTDYGYIAYCFADIQGYSKFGSYTGNGNNDGPFVYTGFKPAWIMIKIATGNTNNWMMYDNQRSLFNLTDKTIEANNNGAEGTSLGIDMLSNGFKTRVTGNGTNLSGSTYIYMAFGQSLVGTNNIPNNAR
jgi:hypothetical protein